MNRRLCALLLLTCCSLNCSMLAMAAAPAWSWVRGADLAAANATATATAVAADPAGNVYVAGVFSNTVKFGTTTLAPPNTNYADVFVAKYDRAGNFLWALPIGGVACNAGGLAATATRVYLVGDCTFGAAFGGTAVPAHPSYGKTFFLATLDPAGSFTKVIGSGGTGSMHGSSIALDADGNVLVAGSFDRSVNLGGAVLTNSGNNTYSDAFVIKFNAAIDEIQWLRSGGSSETDHGYAVAADASGNVLLAGDFGADVSSANAVFGTTTLTIPAFRSGDGFVTKLDKNGNWLWAKSISGWAFDDARAVTADNAGNVYVAGRFSVTGTFGDLSLSAVALNSYYAYVAKLDTNGNFKWAQQAGASENVMDGHAGTVALDVNAAGNPVAGGYFRGASSFGATAITSYNGADLFVAELDAANGNYLAVTRAGGGSGNDQVNAMALAPGGAMLVAGGFEDAASFDNISLQTGRVGEFYVVAPFVGTLTAATQPPSATAVSSGPLSARNILLQNIQVPASALANGVSLYIAADIAGTIYCLTSAGWTTDLMPYQSGITQLPSSVAIVSAMDLRGYIGTTVLVGYGNGSGSAALDDMLQGQKYAVVHTVAP
jgi:hypothetical protein